MTEHGGRDRRREPRTEITSCATIRVEGEHAESHGIVTDVSAFGLALQTDCPPAVGERVTVRATLNGRAHPVQARVVRVDRESDQVFVVGLEYDLTTMEKDPFLRRALHQNRG